MASDLLLLLILVGINGFFVAAEFALVKVRHSQVQASADAGSSVAKSTKQVLDHLEQYLPASQVGITLASLALGWMGVPLVAGIISDGLSFVGFANSPDLSQKLALPVAFVIITTIHIVLGALIPKYIAISDPRPVAFATSLPLRAFAFIVRPLVIFMSFTSRSALRLVGIKIGAGSSTHTEDELRVLLAESARSSDVGSIAHSEHQLIESVFKFDDRMVRQIMVPKGLMIALPTDASPDQIFDVLINEGYTRVPVYSGSRDKITGVVHGKDVLKLIRSNSPISLDTLIRPAYFVPESKKISDLLKEFQEKKTHMAIVIDEFGYTSGLVTLEDVVEELVGEIQDEYDEELPAVERKSESAFVVNAHAPIIDLNKGLPIPLPEGSEYSTLAGLIGQIFSVIPHIGQSKRHGDYEFTILRRSRRGIDSVLLELVEPSTAAGESEDRSDSEQAA